MTSATDNRTTELREKLTERCVKHKVLDGVDLITVWQNDDFSIEFIEHRFVNGANPPTGHCTLTLTKRDCTPEQAIAATLGNDPYDAVSCEHVISSDTLHLILDEWDVHPGWTATNENMAQLFDHTAATLGAANKPNGEPVARETSETAEPDAAKGDIRDFVALTADDVKMALFAHSTYANYDGVKLYASDIRVREIADELNATLGDDDYERRMDELLCRLTNGKWSKSRSYSVDFMVSCVDEAYEDAALGGGECELVYGENDYGDDGWWCKSCGGWFAASFRHTGRDNIIKPRYCQHCGRTVTR